MTSRFTCLYIKTYRLPAHTKDTLQPENEDGAQSFPFFFFIYETGDEGEI